MVVGASVPDGADSAYDMKEMEHNEAFLRFRLGAGAEGDEAAELLLWPAARSRMNASAQRISSAGRPARPCGMR